MFECGPGRTGIQGRAGGGRGRRRAGYGYKIAADHKAIRSFSIASFQLHCLIIGTSAGSNSTRSAPGLWRSPCRLSHYITAMSRRPVSGYRPHHGVKYDVPAHLHDALSRQAIGGSHLPDRSISPGISSLVCFPSGDIGFELASMSPTAPCPAGMIALFLHLAVHIPFLSFLTFF